MRAADEFKLMATIAPFAFELMHDPDIKAAKAEMKKQDAKA